MFTLVSENSFDAAHFLHGYNGKCSNIHGHRWRVVVEIFSDKLSEDRAENVKREIIKLGAHDNQLIVIEEGARVQNYEKNDWNRVVIITD